LPTETDLNTPPSTSFEADSFFPIPATSEAAGDYFNPEISFFLKEVLTSLLLAV
jgi:hypothetical protein